MFITLTYTEPGMDIGGGILLLLGAALIAGFWEHSRRKRKKVLLLGRPLFATVAEYRSEFGRVAGAWTTLDYPYVTYQDEEGAWKKERLGYATSGNREFFIGHLIEVVHFEGVLYYRPVLESWDLPVIGMAAGAFIFGLTFLIPGLASWLGF
ncbi:hypothetical protein GCM10022409_13540 [Hymenobacter glaciei]|uniref:DUF3592 domain-containing protein n=1 Tax=Hymenobacter glaciei TaxID=877209 RepID=A0ABP7TSG6_9BACT